VKSHLQQASAKASPVGALTGANLTKRWVLVRGEKRVLRVEKGEGAVSSQATEETKVVIRAIVTLKNRKKKA